MLRLSLPLSVLLLAAALAPAGEAGAQPGGGIRTDADVRDLGNPTDEPDRGETDREVNALAQVFRMLGALALVLGLIVLAGWLLRRYGQRGPSATARSDVIRIVATKMLGGRRGLMLVRVRGQTLLLGLTPQSITCLTEIQEIEGEWAQPPSEEGQVSSAFDRQLGQFVNETISDDPPSKTSR